MNPIRLTALSFGCFTGLWVIGCDSKAPSTDTPVQKPTESSSKDDSQKTGSTDAPAAPKADLDRSKLPAFLMNDGYRYYGLSSSKPIDVQMKQEPGGNLMNGSITYRLVSVDEKGKSATFEEDTTGTVHDALGNGVIALRPDGIYEVTSDKTPIKRPILDISSDLAAGKSWVSDGVLEVNGQSVRQKATFTSKGVTPLTIAGKTYQALYVEGTGAITGGTGVANSKFVTKEWFVKDIGMVKNDFSLTPKTGKPSKYNLIWIPGGKDTK